VHGGKASKGRKAPRGSAVEEEGPVREDRASDDIGGNGANPMVGNALQHTRPDREEEAGEVGQNHEVGTRMRRGSRIPKDASDRATGRLPPGVDSLARNTTEGRSLDNPKRGSSDDRAGRRIGVGDHDEKADCIPTGVRAAGPGRVGKDGAKVDRSSVHPQSGCVRPG
jgi:hypothetical protein